MDLRVLAVFSLGEHRNAFKLKFLGLQAKNIEEVFELHLV